MPSRTSISPKKSRLREELPQRFVRAAERQFLPWYCVGFEEPRFESFVVAPEASSNHRCGVHHDDGHASRIRVDVDQAIEPHIEAGLLTCFPHRRSLDLFATIHISPGKHPLAV